MAPDMFVQPQGFHPRLFTEFLQALLQGSLHGFPQGPPPDLEVPGQGRHGDISGQELVHSPGEGSGRDVLAGWCQLRGLSPRDAGAGVLPAPPGAPGPHNDDGNPEDSDVVEEAPLAAVRHGLDPAGGTEPDVRVGLDVETQARR
jgi:hypothetical protein